MTEKVRSFTLFEDQERMLDLMSDEQCGKLIRALYAHNVGREVEISDPLIQVVFWQIADAIDRVKAYAEAKRSAGQAGGKQSQAQAKQTSSTGQADTKQPEAWHGQQPSTGQANAPSVSISKSISSSKSKEENKKAVIGGKNPPRFTPPSVEEVAAYCAERHNGIDAQRFCDYYQAQGWQLSNGRALKDWRAAIRNWESRNHSAPTQGQVPPKRLANPEDTDAPWLAEAFTEDADLDPVVAANRRAMRQAVANVVAMNRAKEAAQ